MPEEKALGTVLVVHEIFGLTPHIRSVCDRLAVGGYVAIAPDLFAHALHGEWLPYTAEGKAEGLAIKNALGEAALASSVLSLLTHPACRGPVAVMGFCLGGAVAWLAARDQRLAAAIGYYSVGLARHLDQPPRAPVLMHFGLRDASIPKREVEALAGAYPQVEVHEYDAGHAFNRDDDGSYVADAAELAWARSLRFLERHLKDGA